MQCIENKFSIFDNNSDIVGFNNELKAQYLNYYHNKYQKNLLYVSSSLFEANKLYQALQNYNVNVLLFPMDDFLTSEALAISPELKITRLETLNELINNNKPTIVVTNLLGFLRFLPNKSLYRNSIISLKKNVDFEISQLITTLCTLGYQKESTVSKTGEFAVRGFVIDVFPISYTNPVRIEFWGDTVDSIREFDVNTQLTINNKLDSVTINPNTEFLTTKQVDTFDLKQRDLINYEKPVSIYNYLEDSLLFYDNYDQIQVNYEQLTKEMFDYTVSNDLPKDTKYMFSLDEFVNVKHINFSNFDVTTNKNFYKIQELESIKGNINKLEDTLKSYILKGNTVILCVNNRYKVNKLIDELHIETIVTNEDNIFPGKINIIIKNISSGYIFDNYVVFSEVELFNKTESPSYYKTNFKLGTKIRDINKLSIGDYVVHVSHGIGRYLGIKTLEKNGLKKDYLQVEYKDGDKLYVPVERIELLSKYSQADGMVPKLNKIGGTEWAKTKLRVKSRIKDMTAELLHLYAEREKAKGFAFIKDDDNQINFEKEFMYTPTADQIRVTDEIKKDMETPKPMDRLLCGDVGYGKTEVAFRAIFKAILSGKQVAFLCPTTILSNQHYKNAVERFKNYPINIALLNRFVTAKEVKSTIEKVKSGKIDLLIGTHRILSDDIEFKDLGLLVIDEEQRFGVRHKEKIKNYKKNIDVLTLSATPIPRTLQMAMSGIRSLSLIETPPVDRYPIQTYVIAENKQIIKDAIYKELSRQGQLFILFNNIEQMEEKKHEIDLLAPDARIVTAHGRMEKNELENIMLDFINHKFDILLCTTIIETGIDIPNVNTLIIYDADHFGLAQLYQIRGRVGRSNKIAYCYLLYDKYKILSEVAIKRLKVIKDFTELGSGFSIAMRDLSIRGAGNVLGSEQAGFVDSVGIELFMKMLDEEIKKAKGIEVPEEENNDNVNPLVEVSTSISDDYVSDEDLKIFIHQKINSIDSKSSLETIKNEISDRFGKISESIDIYMHEELFENYAKKLGIINVKQTKNFVEILLPKELTSSLKMDELFIKISKLSMMFRFSIKQDNLCITLDTIKLDKHFIYYLVDLLEIILEQKK